LGLGLERIFKKADIEDKSANSRFEIAAELQLFLSFV